MTFGESLGLLLLIAVAAAGAYLYMQRRERTGFVPVTPYAEGLRALLDGDRLKAMQKLKESVATDSSNVDAYVRLGQISAELEDLPRALKIHKTLTFRADLTNAQRIEIYRALANDYLKLDDQPRALEAIEQVLSLAKKDQWALEKKLELLVRRQDWQGAFEIAERVLQCGGFVDARKLAVLKTMHGTKFCSENKERDGRIQFREAIKLDPTLPAPYLVWGDSYVREGRIEEAVKIWRRLFEVNPTRAHLAFERMEKHLFDLGRFSEIEQFYRGLIRSYPQSVHAYAALARFLEKRGDRGDAISVLQDGIQQNPESLWLRRRIIQLYADVRDVEHVMTLTRDILSRVMKESYQFKCDSCGHVVHEPLWLCPVCKKLDTYHA